MVTRSDRSSISSRARASSILLVTAPTFNPNTFTSLRASETSVDRHSEKSGPLPPKVPVPRPSSGTRKPERPRCRYSMAASFSFPKHQSVVLI